ncbi:MAG: sulfur carrier protein ThiS [Thiobacillaceae bacterium]
MITVSVNGQTHQFDPPLNVAGLLQRLDLTGKRLAVERNGEIVPKSQHGCTAIADGDRLEIVVAVGGG